MTLDGLRLRLSLPLWVTVVLALAHPVVRLSTIIAWPGNFSEKAY
jgi:hypothetical protein